MSESRSLGKVQLLPFQAGANYIEIEHIDVGNDNDVNNDRFISTQKNFRGQSVGSRTITYQEFTQKFEPQTQRILDANHVLKFDSKKSDIFFNGLKQLDRRPKVVLLPTPYLSHVLSYGESDGNSFTFSCDYQTILDDHQARCHGGEYKTEKLNLEKKLEDIAAGKLNPSLQAELNEKARKTVLNNNPGKSLLDPDILIQIDQKEKELQEDVKKQAQNILDQDPFNKSMSLLGMSRRKAKSLRQEGYTADAIGYLINYQKPESRITWPRSPENSYSGGEELKTLIQEDLDYLEKTISLAESIKKGDEKLFSDLFKSHQDNDSNYQRDLRKAYPGLHEEVHQIFITLSYLKGKLEHFPHDQITLKVDESWSYDANVTINIKDLRIRFQDLIN